MIKQTQTKLFDFSDVGLDFCAGSKNKFPEVFKKMLATGFNPQIANSVSIAGGVITLTYGVSHGYVADRVLQVTASGGFNKEVYIDSVSGNDVVCTVIDGVTTGLTGTINTRVASIGWDIVYEVGNIHIYKMKHIDDTDMYVRFCFQNNASQHNAVAVCIGKTADIENGVIIDEQATPSNASVTTPFNGANLRWEFSTYPHNVHNNWTYSQGVAEYGKGVCVGSSYHLIFMHNNYVGNLHGKVCAILPTYISYISDGLKYPVVFGEAYGVSGWGTENAANCTAFIGKSMVSLTKRPTGFIFDYNSLMKASNSYLPASIDSFNTTTVESLFIYDKSTGQLLGNVIAGLYIARYSNTNYPNVSHSLSPSKTYDIDFEQVCYVHGMSTYPSGVDSTAFLVAPIEEIRHGI